jgi:hypothetical protein
MTMPSFARLPSLPVRIQWNTATKHRQVPVLFDLAKQTLDTEIDTAVFLNDSKE